ncbi:unnamed protein product [Diabrotica balteata]|uniref:Uncharacterized protein n=1 Tax=Diabrotica balteata TaxID=107213 RepID=A0A9N9XHW8_DIABA|nr:unnamed protein product [Diabrotica balteata]
MTLFILVLPHITPFTFEDEANAGDSVQVSCYVNKGDMPLSFSWMFNGKKIPEDKALNISPFGTKTSVLSIDNVEGSHAGNYTCVVSNKAGISTHSTELLVKVLPHVIPFVFEEEANSGDRAQLTCSVSKGDTPMTFSWQFNGVPVSDDKGITVGMFGKKTSLLSIDSVDWQHAGNYTCIVMNKAGSASHSAELLVKVLPHVTPFIFEDEANSGDMAQVSCSVSKGDTPMKFSWQFNGIPVSDDKGITVGMFGKKTSLLSIDSVDWQHAGNYTCIVTNKAGSASHSAELLVKVLPHVMPFTFEEEANSGDTAQITCSVTKGDTPMKFSWLFNNKPINENKGITVGMFGKKASHLSIDSVDWKHAGNYTCVVKNNAGTASQSAELLVKGTIF